MTKMNSAKVRDAIRAAFQAAVASVDPFELVKNKIHREGDVLFVCDQAINLKTLGRIVVIGTGKASARMAQGLEAGILQCPDGENILATYVNGLVNVPDGSDTSSQKIEIHCARPAGKNAVTDRVISGTQRMLELLAELGPNDVVIDLISGGGSALREAFEGQLSMDEFLQAQDCMSGTDIVLINAVRKHLSRVKGGKLNLATKAGLVIAMVLSDVVDDPLDAIASGPWAENTISPSEALQELRQRGGEQKANAAFLLLQSLAEKPWKAIIPDSNVQHFVIGNNEIARAAMIVQAECDGFEVEDCGSGHRGDAKEVGVSLSELALRSRQELLSKGFPTLFLYGGETTVTFAEGEHCSKGGRAQELALAAANAAWEDGMNHIVFFALATDGEDGCTNVAGVIVTSDIVEKAKTARVSPDEYLALNNEFPFWNRFGGLVKTGLTGTNVCDFWGFAIIPD